MIRGPGSVKSYIEYYLLPPATKLGQGYIFTGVCYSVNRGICSGRCLLPGGVSAPGCLVETPPGMATAAGGTQPTGMHSCSELCHIIIM